LGGCKFSPDGKYHLSLNVQGQNEDSDLIPMLISQTKDFLQYHQQCEESQDGKGGIDTFLQKAKQIPHSTKSFYFAYLRTSPAE
jgi:hypothetical protein